MNIPHSFKTSVFERYTSFRLKYKAQTEPGVKPSPQDGEYQRNCSVELNQVNG